VNKKSRKISFSYQGRTSNSDVMKRDVTMLWNGDDASYIWSTFKFFRTSKFRRRRLEFRLAELPFESWRGKIGR